jgi:menaquinone-dependent protoporphyrinogen oxidase
MKMKRILVTYATLSGTTVEVAEAVAEELAKLEVHVDIRPIADVTELEEYDGVVVGAPMILGWHRAARRFLRRNRRSFESVPLAIFITAMSLTVTEETTADGVPLIVDEELAKPPANPERLTLRERYATVANYTRPILRSVRPAKPVSVALFGGRLDYGRLKWWAVLFAMLLVQAQAGDKRNWAAIRAWAADLPEAMGVKVASQEST